MKKLVLLPLLFFCLSSYCQSKNNMTTGTTFVQDPNFYKRLLEKWNYDFTPPPPSSKGDSVPPLGKLTFWMVDPVKTDTGMWSPNCSFDIYPKSGKDYCYRLSGRFKDNPNCTPEARGGDMYTVGDFILLNRENCPNCIAYFTGANFCASKMKLIFKSTKVGDKATVQDLLDALPVQKGTFPAPK